MTDAVGTIGAHYRRQATPEVWAEVDALRKRVAELEALVAALRAASQGPTDNERD
jgi:hypothetical protein